MKGNQMKNRLKSSLIRIVLVAAGLFASAASSQAQEAMATISGTAVTGGFDYTILLENTGGTDLNGFWYGWTFGGNNLPSSPSNAGNSLGWDNNLSGTSIIWQNNTGTALGPGETGSFTFFSTDTPTAITTSPSGASVAYVGAVLGSANTPDFSPTLVAAPEPSTLALFAAGAAGMLASIRRKIRVN
jgi:hypothetical protein